MRGRRAGQIGAGGKVRKDATTRKPPNGQNIKIDIKTRYRLSSESTRFQTFQVVLLLFTQSTLSGFQREFVNYYSMEGCVFGANTSFVASTLESPQLQKTNVVPVVIDSLPVLGALRDSARENTYICVVCDDNMFGGVEEFISILRGRPTTVRLASIFSTHNISPLHSGSSTFIIDST